MKQIFIIAGEASGDLHGSMLMRSMKKRIDHVEFAGIGGPRMEWEGLRCIYPSSDIAVVGLVEVFYAIKKIWEAYQKAIRYLKTEKPLLLILIDFPDFNLLVAKKAKKLGIPVFYYISPQVWAWRTGRVKKIKRLVDKMAVILPFEKEFYKGFDMQVEFVGHPLLDVVNVQMNRVDFCEKFNLDPTRPILGLLPGSRKGEISRMLEVMLGATRLVMGKRPDVQFILPIAPGLSPDFLKPVISDLPVTAIENHAYDAMAASDLLLAASGTVTLEAGILGIPMVVTYKVSPVSHFLGRWFINVPWVSLVNLVAEKEIVPEVLQHDATPERLACELINLLNDRTRLLRMKEDLKSLREKLGSQGAGERAAMIAASLIENFS